MPSWGFLLDRIDHYIAVSDQAKISAERWIPHEFEVIPNGVGVPPEADPANRENSIVFIGRHDPRKGMPVLLRAWPDIHRRTGARLRLVGRDPLAVQLLLTRHRVPEEGIDVLGFLPQEQLTAELLPREGSRRPLGRDGELRNGADACVRLRGAGCGVGHSGVQGRHDRRHGRALPGAAIPTRLPRRSGTCSTPSRGGASSGEHARRIAIERYSWDRIAERLEQIYREVAA